MLGENVGSSSKLGEMWRDVETPGLSFMPATAAVAGSSPLRQELHEVRAQGPAVPDAKQPIPVHIQDLPLKQ